MCRYHGELWENGYSYPLFITEDCYFKNVYDVCLYGLKDREHEYNGSTPHYFVRIFVDGVRKYHLTYRTDSKSLYIRRFNSDGTIYRYVYNKKFDLEVILKRYYGIE